MKLKQRLNQELPPLPFIQQTAESPPSSSIAGMRAYFFVEDDDISLIHASTASMFNSAQNINITGGLFNVTSVTNPNTVNGASLSAAIIMYFLMCLCC